jgi:uncharacterized phage protein (TIGR01671 family)
MKREILFRGISTISGKWVYGSLITTMDNTFILECDETIEFKDWRSDINTYRVKAETVGQYIERKDKFGKKIFEGDIVQSSFSDTYFGGVVRFDPDEDEGFNAWSEKLGDDPLHYKADLIEVIGNKYQDLVQ